MECSFAGKDVSKDEMAICIRNHDGRSVLTCDAGASSASGLLIFTVVLETGRMANWLYHEFARPSRCVGGPSRLHGADGEPSLFRLSPSG